MLCLLCNLLCLLYNLRQHSHHLFIIGKPEPFLLKHFALKQFDLVRGGSMLLRTMEMHGSSSAPASSQNQALGGKGKPASNQHQALSGKGTPASSQKHGSSGEASDGLWYTPPFKASWGLLRRGLDSSRETSAFQPTENRMRERKHHAPSQLKTERYNQHIILPTNGKQSELTKTYAHSKMKT